MKKSLDTIKGTVAYTFSRRLDEINFDVSLATMKTQIIALLNDPEITRRADAEKFIVIVNNAHNKSQLISTVAAFATGMKAY